MPDNLRSGPDHGHCSSATLSFGRPSNSPAFGKIMILFNLRRRSELAMSDHVDPLGQGFKIGRNLREFCCVVAPQFFTFQQRGSGARQVASARTIVDQTALTIAQQLARLVGRFSLEHALLNCG